MELSINKERLFLSASTKTLAKELKEQLFSSKNLFEKRLVIVDSLKVKQDLMEYFAQEGNKISCGIEYIEIKQLFFALEHYLQPNKKKLPPKIDLFFSIVSFLEKVLSQTTVERGYESLFCYFANTKEIKQKKKRLFSLSNYLSELYISYSAYGKDLIEAWKGSTDWQKQLFFKLFFEGHFTTHQQFCDAQIDVKKIIKKTTLHFFCVSDLTHYHYQILERFSEVFDVSYYAFSPSCFYWGDESSDRTIRTLMKKQSSSEQKEEMASYLYDRNPLVANLGKVGQRNIYCFDQKELNTLELFDEQDLKTEESCLLRQLQSDLFYLQNPNEKRDLKYSETDDSLQLAITTTPLREIEVLKEHLSYLIDKKGIKPSEIVVLAPDIGKYVPLIERVFQVPGEEIPYRVRDVDLIHQSDFAKAFKALLHLAKSRFEKEELFALLERKAFRKKWALSREDVYALKVDIEKANILWGRDENHSLEELGQREFTNTHTWEKGLERLVLSYVTMDRDISDKTTFFKEIELTNPSLFEKFIRIYRDLESDLTFLAKDPSMSLSQWGALFKKLVCFYFEIDEKNPIEKKAVDQLSTFIQAISAIKNDSLGEEPLFSFSILYPWIEKLFSKKTSSIHAAEVEAVRFQSFTPDLGLFAKAISFIGMDESCPGYEERSDLDLMQKEKEPFLPKSFYEDRMAYSFLQMILNVEKSLFFSYSGVSKEDGKIEPPSYFLSELLSYLDRIYSSSIREKVVTVHPSCGFHEKYYRAEKNVSYSTLFSKGAVAHYEKKKTPQMLFYFSFSQSYPSLVEETVDLRDLQKLMKNPLQLFCQKVLGLYLQEDAEKKRERESCLSLSYLDRYYLRDLFKCFEIDHIVEIVEKRGLFPGGMMGEVAKKELEKEYRFFHDALEECGVDKRDLYSLSLQKGCSSPHRQSNGDWVYPAFELELENKKVSIVGTIGQCFKGGFVAWSDGQLHDKMKVWPQTLLLQNLGVLSNPANKVLFVKKKKQLEWQVDHPSVALHSLLEYYFKALQSPSPLINLWADAFNKKDISALEKKINSGFQSKEQEDRYIEYCLSRATKPRADDLMDQWGEFLYEKIFVHGVDGGKR